jgi:hypothetical protein
VSKIIIILLLCVTSIGVSAQTEWKLKNEKDGIKVFAGTTPNSDFQLVRVEFIVGARLSQLVAFLLDVEQQPKWIYNCKSARLVKKIAENELISYSEISLPWPCANRDYISHVTFNQQSPQLLTLDAKAEPGLLPLEPGKVRVKSSSAHWDITPLTGRQLKVVYTAGCDPAGGLPGWLTNIFIAKGAYETFQKLRTCVNNPQYYNARFDFIKE